MNWLPPLRTYLATLTGFVSVMLGGTAGMAAFLPVGSWLVGGTERVEALLLGGGVGDPAWIEIVAIVVGGSLGYSAVLPVWVRMVRRRGWLTEQELEEVLRDQAGRTVTIAGRLAVATVAVVLLAAWAIAAWT